MIALLTLIAVTASCAFIVWRVDRDCKAVERIWKDALGRMK